MHSALSLQQLPRADQHLLLHALKRSWSPAPAVPPPRQPAPLSCMAPPTSCSPSPWTGPLLGGPARPQAWTWPQSAALQRLQQYTPRSVAWRPQPATTGWAAMMLLRRAPGAGRQGQPGASHTGGRGSLTAATLRTTACGDGRQHALAGQALLDAADGRQQHQLCMLLAASEPRLPHPAASPCWL